jgi:voltage-gated potassium channel Kch
MPPRIHDRAAEAQLTKVGVDDSRYVAEQTSNRFGGRSKPAGVPMDVVEELAARDDEPGPLGRHSILLASLIALLVATPLGSLHSTSAVRFSVLLSLVLAAAVYVNSRRRWTLTVALATGLGAIGGVAWAEATGSPTTRIFAHGMGLALLVFTTSLMLNALARARTVSRDVLVGAVCAYLLIGLCFAMAFLLMIGLAPGSLLDDGVAIGGSVADPSARATKLLYFSFVTLTTLGYGDVTPESEIAQMLAVTEAITGQLYVAIFIARLLSLYLIRDPGRAGHP